MDDQEREIDFMNGKKAEYIYCITGSDTEKCSCCKKKFKLSSGHVYKRVGFGGRKVFCSYSCMRNWDKMQQDKDRNIQRGAKNLFTGKYEKKSLKEWAEEMDVSYEDLWYKTRINHIALQDAIQILIMEI